MEKLLAILALMDKYKVEISEYIQWAKENKGLLNAEELERLHSRNVEIEKIIERLNKIISSINLKDNPDSDEELMKIDAEIQKRIILLNKHRFRLLQADEKDQANFKEFMDFLLKWESEFYKLDALTKKNWESRKAELINFLEELMPFVAVCNKNKDKKSRKKISNIINSISFDTLEKSRLVELRNKTVLNSSEENEKMELETASNYTEGLYKLLSKTVVIAKFAVNISDEKGNKIDGKVEYDFNEKGYVVKYVNEAILAHEMQHLIQAMKGQLLYYIDGNPVEYLYDLNDEVEAYKVQFIFDPNTVPGYPSQISKISDITKACVKEIVNNEGRKLYDALPMDDYNASMTLEELTKHPKSNEQLGITENVFNNSKETILKDFLKIGKNAEIMSIKLFFVFVLLTSFFCSCKSISNVAGTYYGKHAKLKLNKDSTFYMVIGLTFNYYQFGDFNIYKNKITLNPHIKKYGDAVPISISAINSNSDSITIIQLSESVLYSNTVLYFDNHKDSVIVIEAFKNFEDTVRLSKKINSLKIVSTGRNDTIDYCPDIINYDYFILNKTCIPYNVFIVDSTVVFAKKRRMLKSENVIDTKNCRDLGEKNWQIPTMKKSFKTNDAKQIIKNRKGLKTARFRCD